MPILSKPHPNPQLQSHLAFFFYGLIGCFLLGCVWQLQLAELTFLNFNQLLLGLLVVVMLLFYLLFLYQKGVVQKLQKKSRVTVFCVLCFQLALMAGYLVSSMAALHRWQNSLDPALEGQVLQLTGQISQMVQIGPQQSRFHFHVEQATIDSKNTPATITALVPAHVVLSWNGGVVSTESDESSFHLQQVASELLPGDRWKFNVKLKAVHGNSNPGGFDYELWMWEQNLRATGSVVTGKGNNQPQLLERTWQHPMEGLRQYWRDQILIMGQQLNTQDQINSGLIAALTVGDQAAIQASYWDIFRLTGVAHLVSISGLHITMFAWLAAHLIRFIWSLHIPCLYKIPAVTVGRWGGLLFAFLYALLSGWGLPAQRTILMLLVVTCLQQSSLRWPWPRVWLLAMFMVVVQDPWALLAVGFWLSFVAVGVLIVSDGENNSNAGQSVTKQPEPWYKRVQNSLRHMLKEQIVVTLALAPLSLLFFQQVSLVGLLANLLAVPWLTFVITPLCMLGVIWQPFWSMALWTIEVLMQFLSSLANVSWAVLELPAAPWYWSAIATVAMAFMLLPIAWQWRVMLLPFLMPAWLWQIPTPAANEFDLWALDVGQGNGLLIRTEHHSLIYDTGPAYLNDTDAGQRIMLPFLKTMALQADLLVLSHQDLDHSGGAASILKAQKKAHFLTSIAPDHELAQYRKIQTCQATDQATQSWKWDGVLFEILHPLESDYSNAMTTNARSCVLKISNAKQQVLLVGDIEKQQEAQLLSRYPQALNATLLLVPHHGSKTSSSAEFLDAVQPSLAIVQSGYRNRYGHPAESVMQRYAERQIQVVATPECGAVYWQSVNAHQVRCNRQVQQRYWHHKVLPQ